MCEPCGKEVSDVAIRGLSYGAVRYATSQYIKVGSDKKGDKEPKIGGKSNKLITKTVVNVVGDVVFDQWIYNMLPKPANNDKMLGLCKCELSKAFFLVLSQMVYEGMYGKISGNQMLRDVIAIYAEFPIHNYIAPALKKNVIY